MASSLLVHRRKKTVLALALLLAACSGDDGEEMNVLPTNPTGDDGSAGDDGGSTMPATMTEPDPSADDTATGGGAVTFPVTYRFDCMDIRILGDGDGDGEADGTAIQANLLAQVWNNDINDYKLNIMLTVHERDEAAGTASIQIHSGIGPDAASLCAEQTTQQPEQPAGFQAGTSVWTDGGAMCSAEGGSGAGTYNFTLTPEDVVYVYAQDTDGTPFNCVPGGGAPNAVPVRAIEADVTVTGDESTGYGELTGCLTAAEAGALCSCIGACMGEPDPDCGDCPAGAHPLGEQLMGVGPSSRCTDLMGEDAFDLVIGFVTLQIPNNPEACP